MADRTVFADVLQIVRRTVPFDSATLYLIDTAGNWEELISLGRPVEPLDFLPIGSGLGLSGWAAHNGTPVLLKDRTRSRHFNPQTDLASFLSVPIPEGENPIGVLNLGGDKPGQFTGQHIATLDLLWVVLAPLLERLVCERKASQTTRELAELRMQMDEIGAKLATGSTGAIAGAMVSHVHEINEQLSIIIGNIDCLLVAPIERNQSTLTRLRRAEEAAVRLRACGKKLLRLTQPRRKTVEV